MFCLVLYVKNNTVNVQFGFHTCDTPLDRPRCSLDLNTNLAAVFRQSEPVGSREEILLDCIQHAMLLA